MDFFYLKASFSHIHIYHLYLKDISEILFKHFTIANFVTYNIRREKNAMKIRFSLCSCRERDDEDAYYIIARSLDAFSFIRHSVVYRSVYQKIIHKKRAKWPFKKIKSKNINNKLKIKKVFSILTNYRKYCKKAGGKMLLSHSLKAFQKLYYSEFF